MNVTVYFPNDREWILEQSRILAEKNERSLCWFIQAALEKELEKHGIKNDEQNNIKETQHVHHQN